MGKEKTPPQNLGRNARDIFISIGLLLTLSSCLPENSTQTTAQGGRGSGVANTKESVSPGYGRLLNDNPIILSGNSNLSPSFNLNALLRPGQEFLVLDQHLNLDCTFLPNSPKVDQCVRVKQERNLSQTTNSSARWAYPVDSNEFLEVNTFGHMKRIIDEYFTVTRRQFQQTWGQLVPHYATSLPSDYASQKAFWVKDRPLWGYANCNFLDNASFNPSTFSICMGRDSQYDSVRWAQDSTIIYHEMGHALNHILMNSRNTPEPSVVMESKLGNLFYDEGNSIDEGISDYASYLMNGRTHIGEWAMGRFNRASRPMSEADGMHIAGINTTFSGRLSYPTYVTYDPNFPSDPLEDVHYAGQIISHYLVALTKDIQNHCHISNREARRKVLKVISESLAELGDLTAKGADSNSEGHINHSQAHAHEWIRINNPINFRSFAQSIARKVNNVIINNTHNNCTYTYDDHEKLLDSYGLLLFRSYNETGNHPTQGHNGGDTKIASSNRVKTVLVPKSLVKLNPQQDASQAFVFDNRSDMVAAVEALKSAGQISDISTLIDSDLPYNNGNGRISPGEVIGIVPNLYNDSNTQIGGVQVLANDWDHFKWSDTSGSKPYTQGRPCNHFDGFPSFSEGGADTSSESGNQPGECHYTTRENGDEDYEQLAPVCMVQVNEDNSTRWAGQNALREKIQLEKNKCLGGSSSPNDCFVRSIRGADQAFYSYIDPKKTWANTIGGDDGSPRFNLSNLIFMEISPWIPPGTTFNCRLRVRFTNCDDCFHDPETDGKDYLDYEYSGARPFKVINFKFTVID